MLRVKLLPGTLILMGACEILDEHSWMKRILVFYFGDLDAHSLIILGRVRSPFPQTQSLLMNLKTFNRWEHLTVKDSNVRFPDPICLTESEPELFEVLLGKRLRLEQELIPMADVDVELKSYLGV